MIEFILGFIIGCLIFKKDEKEKGRIIHCKMPTYERPEKIEK